MDAPADGGSMYLGLFKVFVWVDIDSSETKEMDSIDRVVSWRWYPPMASSRHKQHVINSRPSSDSLMHTMNI